MTLIQVTVSGTVGKQVVPTTQVCHLRGVTISPSGAASFVKIRDGGAAAASGEVVFFATAPAAGGSKFFEVDHKFTKGMHVTVVGTAAEAYLDIS